MGLFECSQESSVSTFREDPPINEPGYLSCDSNYESTRLRQGLGTDPSPYSEFWSHLRHRDFPLFRDRSRSVSVSPRCNGHENTTTLGMQFFHPPFYYESYLLSSNLISQRTLRDFFRSPSHKKRLLYKRTDVSIKSRNVDFSLSLILLNELEFNDSFTNERLNLKITC